MLSHLSNLILAIIASADKELYLNEIANKISITKEELLIHIQEIKEYLNPTCLDISITENSAMLIIKPDYAKNIPDEYRKKKQLSAQAFEVLAIICAKQPCTKQEIDSARGGIDSEKVLENLINAGLVKKLCSLSIPGAPALYSITEQCIHMAGFKSYDEMVSVLFEIKKA
ncbi:hypothetical protein TdN_19970 [Thermodesulfovibrio sp. TK110]